MNKKFVRILALLAAVTMLFSLCSCGSQTNDEEEKIKYAQAVPASKSEIVERFNSLLVDAANGKVAVEYSISQKASGADCENASVKGAFKTVASMITKNGYSESTEYGEDATSILPANNSGLAALITADVRSAYVTDNEADKTYTMVLTINPESNPNQTDAGYGKVYGKLYRIEKDEDIIGNFDVVKDFIKVSSYNAEYGVGVVKVIVDKASGHVTKIELSRDVAVETSITGVGTLESIGKDVPLSFNYSSTENFSIDWDNPETDEVES